MKLAANEDSAFDAAISSAGAAGLVQFIPSTYALMVKKRPDLGLIPDFREGMANHRNAVKAQVASLRLFCGASVDETARALGVSAVTVMRDWRFARAWLHREVGELALLDLG